MKEVDNQEEHIEQSTRVTAAARKTKPHITPSTSKLLAVLAVALLIAVGGFASGMQYQKGKSPSSKAAAASQLGPGMSQGQGRFGGRRSLNGSVGAVTAISASSISVQDRRSGSVKTYSITGTTTILSGGAAASYSDIAVGDNVVVTTADSTSTTATRITLNAGAGSMSSPSGATDPSSQTPPASI